MKSQKQQILNHLKKYGYITPLTAFKRYNIFRLGARIYDLKNEGIEIESVIVRYKRNGINKRYAKYILKGGI